MISGRVSLVRGRIDQRIALVTTLAAAILLASAPGQTGCRHDSRAPELLAPDCAEQKRGWTTDELADIALRAATGQVDREGATVRIAQDGCKIHIGVNLKELHAGSHFLVTVSAIDGSVLEVVWGE